MTHILVLGGGPAGVTAALRARELGADVTLVERGRLGGTCTNDGCAPTRVLAKAARLAREAHQFDEYGLVGEPPTVDFGALMMRVQHTIYRLQEKKQLLSHLQQVGVTVYTETGDMHFVDPHSITNSDTSLTLQANAIILCVGGHARRMNFEGADLALTHSDVWTLKQLPRSVAIVGGAATGCQLASIFNAFGAHVTILDAAPRILPGEDEAVSRAMTQLFSDRNIALITGIGGVDRIERTSDGRRLHYRAGDAAQTLEAEAVILATGWPGNIEGLSLAAAGIDTERGYIKVNENLQTSAPHIFAAGDITGRMMLVQSADYEARAAAQNAVLGPAKAQMHHIVPHGGFTDPEYASVGITEAQARVQEPDCVVEQVSYAELDRAVIDGRPEGFCKLIVSRATQKLLGVHVVGEQAVEVVQIVAGGMAAGMTVTQLAELELAYPTYSAIVGSAARQLVRQLNLLPLAPQWLALGRRGAEWERRD
jgi:pyruvate/2-oxoglutarate dehydrogenase complex dihydrolipoamide dehydrogenase (E3) component